MKTQEDRSEPDGCPDAGLDSGGLRRGARFCPLVRPTAGKNVRRCFCMLILGIIIVLLGAYLLYALVSPEKF